jgi:hypothetical protein
LAYSVAVVGGVVVIEARGVGVTATIHLFRAALLLFFSLCMLTERGGWGLWRRIAFVAGAWLAFCYVALPLVFVVLTLCAPAYPPLITEVAIYGGSVPLVMWAMRHSRLFVMDVRAEHGQKLGSVE